MSPKLKLVAMATLVVALGACSKDKPSTDTPAAPTTAESTATVAAASQTVSIPGGGFTVQIPAEMKLAQENAQQKAFTSDNKQAVLLGGQDISAQFAQFSQLKPEAQKAMIDSLNAAVVGPIQVGLEGQFPDMQVLSKGEVKVGEHKLQKLEATLTAPGLFGQKAHAVFAFGIIDQSVVIIGTMGEADDQANSMQLFEQVSASLKKA